MKSGHTAAREHAILMGGSIAGLLAARALANHFEKVTLIERDTFPSGRDNRRGVPQGQHTHGLLGGGREVLEAMFPGLSNELISNGAIPGDIVGNSRWFFEGGCHAQFASGLNGLLMSRPFVESHVRDRVRRLSNVEIRENSQVTGLLSTRQRGRVRGVEIGSASLFADLVVDATGRGSHSARWLEAMGYEKPSEERVEIALAYTTRCFRRRPTDLDGDVAVIIPPTPDGKLGGTMIAQEDSRWTVTLTSHFKPAAPSDLAGFVEFTRQLPAPYIYEVIRNADAVSEPVVARFPASIRRRYERLKQFPEGYLVMGDAMCSFNPVYGQGMTVAAMEARELDCVLREVSGEGLARRFFASAARVVDIPWSIAVGNDLRMPEAKGPRSIGVMLINAYMAKLHKVAHHDSAVALAFHRVGNLLAPPTAVLHPRIAFRVFWKSLLGRNSKRGFEKSLPARMATHL